MTTCCAICRCDRDLQSTIDPELIAKARDEDPESAEAEWSGGWRRDIAAFLSRRATSMLRLIMIDRWSCRRAMG